MRVLVAPQELKGSLTAAQAAAAIAEGVRRGAPADEVIVLPLADGGPGTLDALVSARRGEIRTAEVCGPLGEPVTARYGLIGDTAVVETAEACGLSLLRGRQLDPAHASTYGVGQLLRAALDASCRRFLLGIGGSATNDGGAGMAQALGFHLLDAAGHEVERGPAGLGAANRIDAAGADARLAESSFDVAVDVTNPLCGPQGATAVFGPQKGVSPEQEPVFDAALRRLGELIERDLGVPVLDVPGGGAAGGLGAGLAGFLHARLRSGFALVAEALDVERQVAAADLVLTGEGRLDAQTPFGKTVAGVSAFGARYGVPVVALVGGIAPEFRVDSVPGLTAAFALTSRPLTLSEAEAGAAALLAGIAEQVTRLAGARRSNPAQPDPGSAPSAATSPGRASSSSSRSRSIPAVRRSS